MAIDKRYPKKAKLVDALRPPLSALLSAPWYVWLAAILLAAHWLTPYDDTDDTAAGERSGMVLYTDHGTGCQYLKAGMFGGMTPRMDGKGTHVGCR